MNVPEIWFYLSFIDPERPRGTQFLGGCYLRLREEHREEDELLAWTHPRRVRALDGEDLMVSRAISEAHRLGINPGGEVQVVGPIPRDHIEEHVPAGNRERLLTREEIEGA